MPRTKSGIPQLRQHKPSRRAVVTIGGKDHYLGPWPLDQEKTPAPVQELYDRVLAVWLANGRSLPPDYVIVPVPLDATAPAKPPTKVSPLAGAATAPVATSEPAPPLPPDPVIVSVTAPPVPAFTVNELLVRYVKWGEDYYKHTDGTPTSELQNIKDALRPLRKLYGTSDATKFGPVDLRALQDHLVRSGKLCRNTINARVQRVRRMFKWAASHGLVPVEVHVGLTTVDGLKAGRTTAKETDRIKPVPPADVEKVLPYLSSPVRVMVQVQLHSGCRTGEVLVMRAADIDTSGPVWVYKPHRHKNTYRGHERTVYLGPKAQAALEPFMLARCPRCGLTDRRCKLAWRGTTCGPCADILEESQEKREFPVDPLPLEWKTRRLFRPCDALADRYAELRAKRKSKIQPSQKCRKKAKPKRKAGQKYDRRSYRQAIVRACGIAGVEPWAPLQLRHAAGTLIRQVHGIEAARVLLGHTKVETSQIYAERDLAQAAKIAAELG